MIFIDFQGGAHGNYLEFVCNFILAKVPSVSLTPFNQLGSSHSKIYKNNKIFNCGHYSYSYPKQNFKNSKIIYIKIDYNDLLPLSCISFLRAGDYNYDVDKLEENTYNKFDNFNYRSLLEVLKERYFSHQELINGYNNIKDTTWPEIFTYDDFLALPEWIKNECIDTHKIQFYQFNKETPNCPRHILREFFKIDFKDPSLHGFIQAQNSVNYDQSNDVFVFPFNAFYDNEYFADYIDKIGAWSGYTINDSTQLTQLHNEFLQKQPYKDTKLMCDDIIDKIKQRKIVQLSNLNLMCESYINAQLESIFNIEVPFYMPSWFTNTREIYKLL